jgi:hypothetical protein
MADDMEEPVGNDEDELGGEESNLPSKEPGGEELNPGNHDERPRNDVVVKEPGHNDEEGPSKKHGENDKGDDRKGEHLTVSRHVIFFIVN